MTSTNPIRDMIVRLQALISTMNALGDDPVVLQYFVQGIDVLVDDIKDEIMEVVNAFVPVEPVEEEEVEEEEEEDVIPTEPLPETPTTDPSGGDTQTGSGTQDPPAEDPPVEDPPAGSEDEDPPEPELN